MTKNLQIICKKLGVLLCFFVCLANVYPAVAATDSIQVKQLVGEEGNGTESPGGNGGGGIILPIDATPPQVVNFSVRDIGFYSATISFDTDKLCLSEIYYGRDGNYALGPVYDHPDSYEISHSYFLQGLEPGVKYYLKLKVKNQKGVENTVASYYFYTLPKLGQITPDVGSLSAVQENKGVLLRWKNPDDSNFHGVQIRRQKNVPALSPRQGEEVFIGFADRFFDANVLDDTKYYYTVFSFDEAGNFSRGVAVSIYVDFQQGGGKDTDNPGSPDLKDASVKDVRDLRASADVSARKIILEWQYAEAGDGLRAEIRRDPNFPPMSPFEGELVYEGPGIFFEDRNVKDGQIYFYTIYVKNKEGKYSKGIVIASELKDSQPSIPDLRWEDMNFIDVESGIPILPVENKIRFLQDRILGLSYRIDVLPADLMTAAIRLGDSYYMLDYSEAEKIYKTSLMVPEDPGEYPFDIVFFNQDYEVFFARNMKLEVLPYGKIYTTDDESVFMNISLEKIRCWLKNLMEKSDECSYEIPVEGAEVKIFRKNEDGVWEVWNAGEFNQKNPLWTGKSGTYGFFLPNGDYEIQVAKEGFSSRRRAVSVRDNILDENIRIYVKKNIEYDIIIVTILLIIIVKIAKKRISDKRKK